MTKMSWTPADEEVSKRLHELYYNDKFFVGRDKLWGVYKDKYPDKPVSQRAVLDWLKHQSIHQTFTKPLKKASITPIIASKRGLLSLDCMKMENFNGFSVIYAMVDIHTKRLFAMASKKQDAQSTIRFFDEVLQKFPSMKISTIISDNGSEFKEPFHSYVEEKGWTHTYNKPHSPQSNPIERYNATMRSMLGKAMAAENTKDWVSLLPTIISNLNKTISFATGQTPLSLDQSTDSMLNKKATIVVQNKAAKRYGSLSQRGNDILVGDLVRKQWDYEYPRMSKPSGKGYFSPTVYKVTSVVPSKYPNHLPSYKIVERDTGKVMGGLWARYQLLKVPADTVTVEEPEERNPPPIDEGENRYEVASIVDKRKMRNGTYKYRVRWRGYRPKDDTWEPRSRLLRDVPDMIKDYDREHS